MGKCWDGSTGWPAGAFLAEYDPEANNGRGEIWWTEDIARAVSIHPGERSVMVARSLIALLRGDRLGWGQPGIAEHELVQDVVGAEAVLAGGVDVASDVEPVLGDVVAGQTAGDLLLGLQRADAAL